MATRIGTVNSYFFKFELISSPKRLNLWDDLFEMLLLLKKNIKCIDIYRFIIEL